MKFDDANEVRKYLDLDKIENKDIEKDNAYEYAKSQLKELITTKTNLLHDISKIETELNDAGITYLRYKELEAQKKALYKEYNENGHLLAELNNAIINYERTICMCSKKRD